MTVPRRQLGPDGPSISQVTYGTMRLRAGSSTAEHADHLCRLHDLGIDTHHSSHEYDSHEAYLKALAMSQKAGRRFRHIVKVAEPGFDDHDFAPTRLTKLLDDRLAELNADTVDSLQWLFRTPDPTDDLSRMATLRSQVDDVTAWASKQVAAGKLLNLSFFPYSLAFAQLVMDLGISSTPTMYLNLYELESVPVLEQSSGFIAIRPLAAGRLGDAHSINLPKVENIPVGSDVGPMSPAASALRFSLLHPGVTTSILSVNTNAHLNELLPALATEPNPEAFDASMTAAAMAIGG